MTLLSGMRVRLHPISGMTFRSDVGTVLRADELDDMYYVILMDKPATYDHGNAVYELSEIVEAEDNMDILPE